MGGWSLQPQLKPRLIFMEALVRHVKGQPGLSLNAVTPQLQKLRVFLSGTAHVANFRHASLCSHF